MSFTFAIMALAFMPLLIGCVYAAINYRKFSQELRVFSWFIFLSGIVQIVSLVLWSKSINNMPVLHVYVGLGFCCIIWFYKTVLAGFINSKILWWAAGLFLAFTILNTLFLQDIFVFNSNALTLESVLVMVLSLSTYTLFLNEGVRGEKQALYKSLSWINSGFFIYFASSLLLFYFGEIIMHAISIELSRYSWVLHSVFITLSYICFLVGLWKHPRT